MSSHFWDKTEITASAASAPYFLLALAWAILRLVIIPFPIGFLLSIDNFIMASVDAWDIKSKWGVWPLITHPRAKKPSYFFKFLEIVTGISKAPGTLIIFIIFFFGIIFKALLIKPSAISS